MKYYKRLKQYKASNFVFEVEGSKAWSYDWWLFSTEYSGSLIFNDTQFTSTTTKHQAMGKSLLPREPDLVLKFTKMPLTELRAALKVEITGINLEIAELLDKQDKPKIHRKTKDKISQEILNLILHRQKVRNLLKEFQEVA